jgi:RadC-like JAB domain
VLDRGVFVSANPHPVPIGVNSVSIGSLTGSIAHPREVFRPAVLLPTAAVVLAHNYPHIVSTPLVTFHWQQLEVLCASGCCQPAAICRNLPLS